MPWRAYFKTLDVYMAEVLRRSLVLARANGAAGPSYLATKTTQPGIA